MFKDSETLFYQLLRQGCEILFAQTTDKEGTAQDVVDVAVLVPQGPIVARTRDAMDKFKMQAASDEGVLATY